MFLNEATTAEAATYLEKDGAESGYVMNLERAWAWRPDLAEGFALLRRQLVERTSLMPTEIALLACATAREIALRRWAEQIARDPNGVNATQVETLRRAGLSEREIFEATVHVAFRLAFSTVNDALGARPDYQLVAAAPAEIREAVTYGWPA